MTSVYLSSLPDCILHGSIYILSDKSKNGSWLTVLFFFQDLLQFCTFPARRIHALYSGVLLHVNLLWYSILLYIVSTDRTIMKLSNFILTITNWNYIMGLSQAEEFRNKPFTCFSCFNAFRYLKRPALNHFSQYVTDGHTRYSKISPFCWDSQSGSKTDVTRPTKHRTPRHISLYSCFHQYIFIRCRFYQLRLDLDHAFWRTQFYRHIMVLLSHGDVIARMVQETDCIIHIWYHVSHQYNSGRASHTGMYNKLHQSDLWNGQAPDHALSFFLYRIWESH